MTDDYQLALDVWGIDKQLMVLAEECAELIHAIMRNLEVRGNFVQVVKEAADVEIMLRQLRVAATPELYDRVVREKEQAFVMRLNQWLTDQQQSP